MKFAVQRTIKLTVIGRPDLKPVSNNHVAPTLSVSKDPRLRSTSCMNLSLLDRCSSVRWKTSSTGSYMADFDMFGEIELDPHWVYDQWFVLTRHFHWKLCIQGHIYTKAISRINRQEETTFCHYHASSYSLFSCT